MANVQIGVGFSVDTSGLKKIQQAFSQLQGITLGDMSRLGGFKDLSASLTQMKTQATQLQAAMSSAFNPKTGMLDYNAMVKNMAGGAQQVAASLANISQYGATGKNAILSMVNSMGNFRMEAVKTESVFSKIGETFKRVVTYQLSTKAFQAIVGSFSDAWRYIKDLDTSLNNIQIVTGNSADSMKQFALNATEAARKLKASTTDYTNAALIYYQQGLNDQQVKLKTQLTLEVANVTGQDAKAVSQQLTAVWNGFQVDMGNAEKYVDKMAAVAANSAANLAELSTGMSKVASSANAMGVDIDQLTAQMATIVSVTRQAPESVGTALKTIYARMSSIKTGAEDAQATLGSYTSKMAQMGVNVLDSSGRLRDMGQVIEQVGGKWSGYSRQQQVALAQTMAGTRQYNNMIALFDNWSQYQSLTDISKNSQGTLDKQQETYSQSIKAHLQELSTAGQGIFNNFFDPESVNKLIDALTKAADLIADMTSGLGGLPGIFHLAATYLGKMAADKGITAIMNMQKQYNAKAHNIKNAELSEKSYQAFERDNRELIQNDSEGQIKAVIARNRAGTAYINRISKQNFDNLREKNDILLEKAAQAARSREKANEDRKRIEADRQQHAVPYLASGIVGTRRKIEFLDEKVLGGNKINTDNLQQVGTAYSNLATKIDGSVQEITTSTNQLNAAIASIASASAQAGTEAQMAIVQKETANIQQAVGFADKLALTRGISPEAAAEIEKKRAILAEKEKAQKAFTELGQGSTDQQRAAALQRIAAVYTKITNNATTAKAAAEGFAASLGKSQTGSGLEKMQKSFKEVENSADSTVEKLRKLRDQLAAGGETGAANGLQEKIKAIEEASVAAEHAIQSMKQALASGDAEAINNAQQAVETAFGKLSKVTQQGTGALLGEDILQGKENIKSKGSQYSESGKKERQDGIEQQAADNEAALAAANAAAEAKAKNWKAVAASAAAALTIFQSIQNVSKILQDSSRTTGQKITAVIGVIIAAFPSIMSAITAVSAAGVAGATSVGTAAATAGVTAQAAWGWIGLLLMGVAAIAAIITSLPKPKTQQQLAEQRLKGATQGYQALTKAAESAKKAEQKTMSSIADYRQAEQALKHLTTGTQEWAEAVGMVNDSVMNLLQLYPQLAAYATYTNNGWVLNAQGLQLAELLAAENSRRASQNATLSNATRLSAEGHSLQVISGGSSDRERIYNASFLSPSPSDDIDRPSYVLYDFLNRLGLWQAYQQGTIIFDNDGNLTTGAVKIVKQKQRVLAASQGSQEWLRNVLTASNQNGKYSATSLWSNLLNEDTEFRSFVMGGQVASQSDLEAYRYVPDLDFLREQQLGARVQSHNLILNDGSAARNNAQLAMIGWVTEYFNDKTVAGYDDYQLSPQLQSTYSTFFGKRLASIINSEVTQKSQQQIQSAYGKNYGVTDVAMQYAESYFGAGAIGTYDAANNTLTVTDLSGQRQTFTFDSQEAIMRQVMAKYYVDNYMQNQVPQIMSSFNRILPQMTSQTNTNSQMWAAALSNNGTFNTDEYSLSDMNIMLDFILGNPNNLSTLGRFFENGHLRSGLGLEINDDGQLLSNDQIVADLSEQVQEFIQILHLLGLDVTRFLQNSTNSLQTSLQKWNNVAFKAAGQSSGALYDFISGTLEQTARNYNWTLKQYQSASNFMRTLQDAGVDISGEEEGIQAKINKIFKSVGTSWIGALQNVKWTGDEGTDLTNFKNYLLQTGNYAAYEFADMIWETLGGSVIRRIGSYEFSLQDLQKKMSSAMKTVKDIKYGDIISAEDYANLSAAGQQYFALMYDGTYKLIGSAKQFAQEERRALQAQYRTQIEETRNRIRATRGFTNATLNIRRNGTVPTSSFSVGTPEQVDRSISLPGTIPGRIGAGAYSDLLGSVSSSVAELFTGFDDSNVPSFADLMGIIDIQASDDGIVASVNAERYNQAIADALGRSSGQVVTFGESRSTEAHQYDSEGNVRSVFFTTQGEASQAENIDFSSGGRFRVMDDSQLTAWNTARTNRIRSIDELQGNHRLIEGYNQRIGDLTTALNNYKIIRRRTRRTKLENDLDAINTEIEGLPTLEEVQSTATDNARAEFNLTEEGQGFIRQLSRLRAWDSAFQADRLAAHNLEQLTSEVMDSAWKHGLGSIKNTPIAGLIDRGGLGSTLVKMARAALDADAQLRSSPSTGPFFNRHPEIMEAVWEQAGGNVSAANALWRNFLQVTREAFQERVSNLNKTNNYGRTGRQQLFGNEGNYFILENGRFRYGYYDANREFQDADLSNDALLPLAFRDFKTAATVLRGIDSNEQWMQLYAELLHTYGAVAAESLSDDLFSDDDIWQLIDFYNDPNAANQNPDFPTLLKQHSFVPDVLKVLISENLGFWPSDDDPIQQWGNPTQFFFSMNQDIPAVLSDDQRAVLQGIIDTYGAYGNLGYIVQDEDIDTITSFQNANGLSLADTITRLIELAGYYADYNTAHGAYYDAYNEYATAHDINMWGENGTSRQIRTIEGQQQDARNRFVNPIVSSARQDRRDREDQLERDKRTIEQQLDGLWQWGEAQGIGLQTIIDRVQNIRDGLIRQSAAMDISTEPGQSVDDVNFIELGSSVDFSRNITLLFNYANGIRSYITGMQNYVNSVNQSITNLENNVNGVLGTLEDNVNDAVEDLEDDVNSVTEDLEDGLNSIGGIDLHKWKIFKFENRESLFSANELMSQLSFSFDDNVTSHLEEGLVNFVLWLFDSADEAEAENVGQFIAAVEGHSERLGDLNLSSLAIDDNAWNMVQSYMAMRQLGESINNDLIDQAENSIRYGIANSAEGFDPDSFQFTTDVIRQWGDIYRQAGVNGGSIEWTQQRAALTGLQEGRIGSWINLYDEDDFVASLRTALDSRLNKYSNYATRLVQSASDFGYINNINQQAQEHHVNGPLTATDMAILTAMSADMDDGILNGRYALSFMEGAITNADNYFEAIQKSTEKANQYMNTLSYRTDQYSKQLKELYQSLASTAQTTAELTDMYNNQQIDLAAYRKHGYALASSVDQARAVRRISMVGVRQLGSQFGYSADDSLQDNLNRANNKYIETLFEDVDQINSFMASNNLTADMFSSDMSLEGLTLAKVREYRASLMQKKATNPDSFTDADAAILRALDAQFGQTLTNYDAYLSQLRGNAEGYIAALNNIIAQSQGSLGLKEQYQVGNLQRRARLVANIQQSTANMLKNEEGITQATEAQLDNYVRYVEILQHMSKNIKIGMDALELNFDSYMNWQDYYKEMQIAQGKIVSDITDDIMSMVMANYAIRLAGQKSWENNIANYQKAFGEDGVINSWDENGYIDVSQMTAAQQIDMMTTASRFAADVLAATGFQINETDLVAQYQDSGKSYGETLLEAIQAEDQATRDAILNEMQNRNFDRILGVGTDNNVIARLSLTASDGTPVTNSSGLKSYIDNLITRMGDIKIGARLDIETPEGQQMKRIIQQLKRAGMSDAQIQAMTGYGGLRWDTKNVDYTRGGGTGKRFEYTSEETGQQKTATLQKITGLDAAGGFTDSTVVTVQINADEAPFQGTLAELQAAHPEVHAEIVQEFRTEGQVPGQITTQSLPPVEGQQVVNGETVLSWHGEGDQYIVQGSGSLTGATFQGGVDESGLGKLDDDSDSGGGGGGGSDKPKKHDVERVDIFHNINNEIQDLTHQLSLLSSAQQKLAGNGFVQAMEKQLNILQQQNAAYAEKARIAQQGIAADREQLANFFTAQGIEKTVGYYDKDAQKMLKLAQKYGLDQIEVQFAEDGHVLNYNELKKQIQQIRNQGGSSEDDDYKYLKQLGDAYMKVLDEIQGYTKEFQDTVAKLEQGAYNLISKRVALYKKESEEMKNLVDFQKTWNKFSAQIINNFARDTGLTNAITNTADAIDLLNNGSIETATRKLTQLTSVIANGADGTIFATTSEDIKNLLKDSGALDENGNLVDIVSAQTMLKQQIDNAEQLLNDLRDVQENVMKSWADGIASVNEAYNNLDKAMSKISEQMQHDRKLISTLYGEDAYGMLQSYYDKQIANESNRIAMYLDRMKIYQGQMERAQAAMDASDGPNTFEYEKYKEVYNAAQEQYASAIDSYNKDLESFLGTFVQAYENAINRIAKDFEDSITNNSGFDWINEQWQAMTNNPFDYLDVIDTAFGVQDVRLAYLKAIDQNADVKYQSRIRDLMEQQLALLENRANVSQYQLDRAKALLEIQKARIELEEAQQNKSTMRLRRDSQGNYTYQYVADQDDIIEKQKRLNDAMQDIYDKDRDNYQKALEQKLKLWQDYIEKMRETASDVTLTEEQRQKRMDSLTNEFGPIAQEGIEYITRLTQMLIESSNMDKQYMNLDSLDGMHDIVEKLLGTEASDMLDFFASLQTAMTEGNYQNMTALMKQLVEGPMLEMAKNMIDLSNPDSEFSKRLDQMNLTAEQREELINGLGSSSEIIGALEGLVTSRQNEIDAQVQKLDLIEDQLNLLNTSIKSAESTLNDIKTALVDAAQTYEDLLKNNASEYAISATITRDQNGVESISKITGSMSAFDTGGYTGSWGTSEGKLAILHQKELILNKDDTANLLDIVGIVRELEQFNLVDSIGRYLTMLTAESNLSQRTGGTIEQTVHIEANFPGVTDSTQIKDALDNLVNVAAQRAMITRH